MYHPAYTKYVVCPYHHLLNFLLQISPDQKGRGSHKKLVLIAPVYRWWRVSRLVVATVIETVSSSGDIMFPTMLVLLVLMLTGSGGHWSALHCDLVITLSLSPQGRVVPRPGLTSSSSWQMTWAGMRSPGTILSSSLPTWR